MSPSPPRHAAECSLVVNTFEKPRHLRLVLESIAAQAGVDGRIEVIVADDGSRDATADVVAAFAASAPFPVHFTSEQHDGFRAARVRNRGARLAGGGYLLFLDGDCVLPCDHVAAHLARRRPGTAQLGDCARLPEAACAGLVDGDVADLAARVPATERRRLRRRHRRNWWHCVLRHPTKPRLVTNNVGMWRADFERVNGFDERFAGWGQEDDDLGLRLRAAGVRLESILDRTWSLHVWHPVDPSAGRRWRDGPNVARFLRRGRITACRRGLVERPSMAVAWGLPADVAATTLGRTVATLLAAAPRAAPRHPCEIDLVVRPGTAVFSRPAECRLVVAGDAAAIEPGLRRAADQVAVVDPRDGAAIAAVLESAG